jgi:prepilin-type N-terminal cleavage/methylation domain-containing protein
MLIKNNRKKGFTLIELLVVISIIALLSTIVMASLNAARSKARDAKRAADLKQVQIAIELFRNDNGYYPQTKIDVQANYFVSFDSVNYKNVALLEPSDQTLSEVLSSYIKSPSDPKKVTAQDGGYIYFSRDKDSYCFMIHKTPENLKNFGSNLINPTRCGGVGSDGQCNAVGTGNNNTDKFNSIYIGTGIYADVGC